MKNCLFSIVLSLLALLFFLGISRAESIIIEKNLFSADRRPPSSEQAVSTMPKDKSPKGLPPKSIQLDGVFIQGEVKKALIRVSSRLPGMPKGKERFPYATVTEGDSVGDYKVVKIDSKSLSLEKGGQIYTVSLFMDGKVVPPAAPLPASPISPPSQETPASPKGKAQQPVPQKAPKIQQAGMQGGKRLKPSKRTAARKLKNRQATGAMPPEPLQAPAPPSPAE